MFKANTHVEARKEGEEEEEEEEEEEAEEIKVGRMLALNSLPALTPLADRYKAMARPSLDVDPVRKISFTPEGIFCRMAAAVSVLPCTTRTLSPGCLSMNICPPPLSALQEGH